MEKKLKKKGQLPLESWNGALFSATPKFFSVFIAIDAIAKRLSLRGVNIWHFVYLFGKKKFSDTYSVILKTAKFFLKFEQLNERERTSFVVCNELLLVAPC